MKIRLKSGELLLCRISQKKKAPYHKTRAAYRAAAVRNGHTLAGLRQR
jgi:hypothetical protein